MKKYTNVILSTLSEEIIFKYLSRCRTLFKKLKISDLTKAHIEILGSEHNYGPMSKLPQVILEFKTTNA